MPKKGRHAALGQDGFVLQQSPDEAPSGQLTQQICEELHEALAVQQFLLVFCCCQICGGVCVAILHGVHVRIECNLIQDLQKM